MFEVEVPAGKSFRYFDTRVEEPPLGALRILQQTYRAVRVTSPTVEVRVHGSYAARIDYDPPPAEAREAAARAAKNRSKRERKNRR